MTEQTINPNEESVYVIGVSFLGVDGTAFIPKTCTWSLTDESGNTINERLRVSATVSGTEHNFILQGKDLAVVGDADTTLIFTVEGTYDSDYGNDLAFREETRFVVTRMALDPAVVV